MSSVYVFLFCFVSNPLGSLVVSLILVQKFSDYQATTFLHTFLLFVGDVFFKLSIIVCSLG